MADNNKGWNQLKRNTSSFMTDKFDLGDGLKTHSTWTFNGDKMKYHDSFNMEGYTKLKIFSDGSTNLKKF